MMPESAKLREFAMRYTAAWCSQDSASVGAHYSPEGSLSINDGAPATGRSAITEVAQGFMTAFPDMRVLMDDLLVQGDRAVYPLDAHRHQHRARWDQAAGSHQRLRGMEDWR